MPNVGEQTCEVKIGEAWRSATLAEGRNLYTMAQKRCPARHGQVMVAGTYTGAACLKLQHRQAHSGCPLTPKGYTGTSSPHPQALT